jgi:hypothetical protein
VRGSAARRDQGCPLPVSARRGLRLKALDAGIRKQDVNGNPRRGLKRAAGGDGTTPATARGREAEDGGVA